MLEILQTLFFPDTVYIHNNRPISKIIATLTSVTCRPYIK